MKSKKKIIREIYWHDANYPDENNWLSKKDILKNVGELIIHLKTQKQEDSYGDKVLAFEGTLKNLKEFKQKIKEGK